MSKLMTLGIILSAKDMLSSVLGKSNKALQSLQKSAEQLHKKTQHIDKPLEALASKIQDADREMSKLANRKLKLKQDFQEGKITADAYKDKLSLIERKHRALSRRKLRLSDELKKANKEAQKTEQKLSTIQRKIEIINKLNSLSSKTIALSSVLVGAGVAAQNMSETPIRSYTKLEESQTALKIALMQNGGKISNVYEEINKQALALGNKLPGTTFGVGHLVGKHTW